MNIKEAREILKPFEAYKKFPVYEMGQVFTAKGYLEGLDQGRAEIIEKAKGLEEALDKMLKPYIVTEENYYLGADDISFAKEALAKYQEEK